MDLLAPRGRRGRLPPNDKRQPGEPLATILIIAVFFVSINLRRWLVWLGFDALNQSSPTTQLLIGYLFWVVPSLLTLLIICDFDLGRVARDLGLKANPWKAVLLAFISSLPMMLGYYATTKTASLTASIFFKEAFLPGVFEEYIFRGFLIGQLFKRGRLGFIPAVIIGSFALALGHLYQGATFPVMIGVIIITAVGSAWFAWLFIEWGRNLYLVMSLHVFMNLWWSVFPAGQNALGGVSANVIRLLTVAVTVIVTIIVARRTGFKIKGRDWISAPRAERH